MENSQYDYIEDGIHYRFLTESDTDILHDFVDRFNEIMKMKKTEQIDYAILKTLQSELVKVSAAFSETGELLLINSGHFPIGFSYWYGFNHISAVKKTQDFALLSHKTDNLLCSYAEERSYFAHYARREVGHQKAFTRIISKVKDARYNIYNEFVYKAGEECKYSNHRFYFHLQPSFPVDTLICLYSLKQEYRDKLLKLE